MKITFVLPFASVSGGVRVIALYANALARRGHDVTVVSLPARKLSVRHNIPFIKTRKRLAQPVPAPFFKDLGAQHRIIDRCRAITASDVPDADVVVATWWETAEWVQALPLSKGQKAYLIQGYEMWPGQPFDRVAATYASGLHNIAVSRGLADTLRENHGVHSVDIIPNGVDTDQFNQPPRDRNRRLRVGFIYSPFVVKNMPLMFDVLQRAAAAIPDLEVLAFGTSPLQKPHGLRTKIDFVLSPPQSRIPALYSTCDAWLITSSNEGFCLPLLEAMACRTPVLGTSTGATSEILREGVNGWLLPADADSFVDKLLHIRSMPAERWRRMSENARATAMEWDWSRRINEMEATLCRIGGQSRLRVRKAG